MSERYLTLAVDGSLAITTITGDDTDGTKLAKNLFELSRTTDTRTHFNPAIHTRAAIAAGISGHRGLTLIAECDHTELPNDRYFRNAWEWSD